MKYCGIDPGLTGAAALLEIEDGDILGPKAGRQRVVDIIDLPIADMSSYRCIDVIELRRWLRTTSPDYVWIEAVHAMPKNGSMASFSLGDTRGSIRSTVLLAGITPRFVDPLRWKRTARILGADKDASRSLACDNWRDARPYLKRKKDHGRADALCIAAYGAGIILGEQRAVAWKRRARCEVTG